MYMKGVKRVDELAVIIGRNIDELRVSRGVSKKDLAALLGVTRPTLDNYIKGNQIIDSGKLALLAREFNKSLDFFLTSPKDEASTLMYRAERAADTPEQIIDGIVRRFELYSQLLRIVGQRSVFIPPTYALRLEGKRKLTDLDKRVIEDVALKCRRVLGLEGVAGHDLFLALEEVGISILAFPTDPAAQVWGASAFSTESGAFIYVNDHTSVAEERKIFSLIHELGHLILHRDRYSLRHSEVKYVSRRQELNEKVADHFASSFLVPRHKLQQEVEGIGDVSIESVFYLKRKFRVSFQAIVMALKNYSMISDKQSGRLFAFLNARGFNKSEPAPLPYFEKNNRYKLYIQTLYRTGEIGLNKVAEFLDLSVVEARQMSQQWGIGI